MVEVPASLLLDPELTPTVKLVWIAARLGPGGPGTLAARAGLTRPTVRKGLAQLAAAGPDPHPARPHASLPTDLLSDLWLGPQAKLLYGALQLTPGFRTPVGQFTYPALSAQCGVGPNALKRALAELARAGWVHVIQLHRRAPVRFALGDPPSERAEAEVVTARQRVEEAPYHGEALMREYLSLLIDSDQFEDDAAPGFLVNPGTDERLQFDRFYPPGVAFEFNGPQHYGPTERFTAADASRQRTRDYIKLGICAEKGIRLVVVHAEDLSLAGMQRKLVDLLAPPAPAGRPPSPTPARHDQALPRRDLTRHLPLVKLLESAGRRYVRAART